MSTKAEQFKSQKARDANPPKPKQPARPRRDTPVDTAQKGVSATDRKAGAGHSGARNVSARAAKKGGAKLEDSATGKASRKSTRKSEGHVKAASSLQRKAIRKTSSSKSKATKATGLTAAKTKKKAPARAPAKKK